MKLAAQFAAGVEPLELLNLNREAGEGDAEAVDLAGRVGGVEAGANQLGAFIIEAQARGGDFDKAAKWRSNG